MARIAKKCSGLGKHVKTSDVMSWAVDGLISYFDANGGKQLPVPPDFSEMFATFPLKEAIRVFYEEINAASEAPGRGKKRVSERGRR